MFIDKGFMFVINVNFRVLISLKWDLGIYICNRIFKGFYRGSFGIICYKFCYRLFGKFFKFCQYYIFFNGLGYICSELERVRRRELGIFQNRFRINKCGF